ncbi:MAG: hypothetical protein KDB27_15105 [Planctomycetales bacterium]|nr:hypothetical protein [Planctomycetales bacterium]
MTSKTRVNAYNSVLALFFQGKRIDSSLVTSSGNSMSLFTIEDPMLRVGSEFTVQFPGELVECVVKTRDLPLSGGFLFGAERIREQHATASHSCANHDA